MMVMVAPNGARRTRAHHPNIPVTPAALARVAAECREAGASAIHIHVRDERERHVLDAERYRDALVAVGSAVGDALVLQITTEAVGRYSAEEQRALVKAVRPESVSVALREQVPDAEGEAAAAEFYAWCVRERVRVQHILYDPSDIRRLVSLRERGVVPDAPAATQLVVGKYAEGDAGEPSDLVALLMAYELEWPWSVCCFGPAEGATSLTAAGLGGHCRVGFENNICLASGAVAESNRDLVHQMVSALTASPLSGRRPATADEVRALGF